MASSSVDAALIDAAPLDAAVDATADGAIDGGVTTGCTDPGNGTTFPVGAACGGWGAPFRDNAAIQNNGGRLVITPVPNEAAAAAGCDHVEVPFGAAGVLAQVDRVLVGASSRTQLELGNRRYSLGVEGGQLVATADATVVARTPYDAITMSWWRLRRLGGVVFEVSPDGAVWTTVATSVTDAPGVMTIRIIGETVLAEPAPGVARIRSINVCP